MIGTRRLCSAAWLMGLVVPSTWTQPAHGDALAEGIVITSSKPSPVLGVDHETELTITVVTDGTGDGPALPPRLRVNTGLLMDLTRHEANRFTARLVFPEQRFPQVAIVAAETRVDGRVITGAIALPLSAVASPAFQTDPGAQVTVQIGAKVFGPESADDKGEVRVPVVVPPGTDTGHARTVNRFGKVAEEDLDLGVPAFERLMILPPEDVSAGSATEIAVHAVDRVGNFVPGEMLRLWADGQRAQKLQASTTGARFLVYAPSDTATPLELRAEIANDQSETGHAVLSLPVGAGPAKQLILNASAPSLPIGSLRSVVIGIEAMDANGNTTSASDTRVFIDGRPEITVAGPDGRANVQIGAPVRYEGRDEIVVEALLGQAYTRQAIPLANLPARARRQDPPMEPLFTLGVRGGMLWTVKQGTGLATAVEALLRRPNWPRALFAGLQIELLYSEVFGGSNHSLLRARLIQLPILAAARVRVRLRRKLEFFFGGSAGINIVTGQMETMGEQVAGTGIAPALRIQTEAAFTMSPGQVVLGAGYLWSGDINITAGDRLLGNTAGIVVDVGYRWRW